MRSTSLGSLALAVVLFLPAVVLAQRPLVSDLSPVQQKRLAWAIVEYADDAVVANHAMFVDAYRPGSGDQFLNMAQAMTTDLEKYLAKRGLVLPAWNPDLVIPRELAVVRSEESGKERPALVNLAVDLPLPRGFRGDRLANFATPQELGDALLPWHNKVHFQIGGSMAQVKLAAATPIFWCWHAYITDVYSEWEQLQPPPAVVVVPPPMPVARRIANPPLKPVSVVLTNSHSEDILVQLTDRRSPSARPLEMILRPRESKTIQVDRDASGEDQVVLVNAAGEVTEVLESRQIPPQPLYAAAVYEYKVVSVYIDRTLKGAAKFQPQEVNKGLRSLGVFDLPSGDSLQDGSELDPAREAAWNNNPGAARHFPMPGQ